MMQTINTNIARVGNFTSSEIVALTTKGVAKDSFGKPANTYISECNMERRLLRSISDECEARPLIWGKLCEVVAFERLGLEYSLNSQETIVHPTIPFWSGSPDGFKEDEGRTVIDIKSPMTLKSFCTMVDSIVMKEINGVWEVDDSKEAQEKSILNLRSNHKDGEKYYWQLVSNAVLSNSRFAELIVFMPYKSELQDIRDMAHQQDGDVIYKYYWIANGNDEELPHLIDGGWYKNINKIRFEVPTEDKEFLTDRVKRGGSMLQNFYKP